MRITIQDLFLWIPDLVLMLIIIVSTCLYENNIQMQSGDIWRYIVD